MPARKRRRRKRTYVGRRLRQTRPHVPLALAGLLAIAVGLVAAIAHESSVGEPPDAPVAIAVVTPVKPPSDPDAGMFASATLHVHSCDEPVDVSVVFGGTRGYWRYAVPRLPHKSRVAVGVSDPGVHGLTLAPAGLTEALVAHAPRTDAAPDLLPGFRQRDVTHVTAQSRPLGEARVAEIDDWQGRGRLAPIVVTLRANWLSRRTASSCYLRLPALVGPRTFVPAVFTQRMLGYEVAFLTRGADGVLSASTDWHSADLGRTFVTLDRGHIDPAESSPSPHANTRYAFSCAAPRVPLGSRAPTAPTQFPAPTARDLRDADALDSGCSGVAVIVDPAAETRHQVRVYLYGTIAAVVIGVLLSLPLSRLLGRRRESIA